VPGSRPVGNNQQVTVSITLGDAAVVKVEGGNCRVMKEKNPPGGLKEKIQKVKKSFVTKRNAGQGVNQ